jgi:hypothetical protein
MEEPARVLPRCTKAADPDMETMDLPEASRYQVPMETMPLCQNNIVDNA